jgi:ferritin-like metal-binding protein YciE
MAKQDKRLDDLFYEALKDIYYAENKIVKALTKMAKAAQSKDLQSAFEKHKGETEGQVHRLERVFGAIDRPAKGKTCDAIDGMIDESLEVMTNFKGSPALDAGLLAAAQRSSIMIKGLGRTFGPARCREAARSDFEGREEDRRGADRTGRIRS